MWRDFWKKSKPLAKNEIDNNRLPRHIAIIMDGNGRWAKRRGMLRTMGHKAGVETLRDIVKTCSNLGIEVLTVYAFSTENWRRPKDEVGILMNLLTEYLRQELEELHKNNVKLKMIGDDSKLPIEAQKELKRCMMITENNQGLALNYGGRAEITNAVKKLSEAAVQGKIRPEEITEKAIAEALFTAGLPDPDLLVRTSGEMRLSNFLLWQLAYTEIVVTECLWPDFSQEELFKAIQIYQKRDRRYGGLKT